LDGDGQVSKYELDHFLTAKGVNESHRGNIVEDLFEKCDTDRNGKISLEEFLDHFWQTKN
jgi:Ca2+-binding EF-hand superfamily protein